MGSPVHLRRAVAGDESLLSLVGQASFLEAFADVLPAEDIALHCQRQHHVDKYRALLSDPAAALWLAVSAPGDAPVGYVVLTPPDLPLDDLTEKDSEVKRIYLLHRFQGLGLGRQLMQVAEAHARQQGKQRLLLGVYSGNETAVAFYERQGFVRVGTRTFLVGSRHYHDLILGKPLL